MGREYHDMTALELGRAIAAGAADPCAVTEHFLDRIAAHDPQNRVFVSLTRERALAEAEAARGRAVVRRARDRGRGGVLVRRAGV